jgi:hypothetical protein
MIGTEAVLRINNEAEVSSESYDCEGCLFALVD